MINMVATYAWGAGVGVAHSAAAKAGVLSLLERLLWNGEAISHSRQCDRTRSN